MSTEAIAPRAPKDEFLALIQRAVEMPEVSADKLEKLINLQLKLEDRHAEKLFNTALIDARKKILAIGWDKTNPHTKSNYATYPKIDKELRPIMEAHGFSLTFGAEPSEHASMMIMYADLMHEGGHTRRYPLPMPIDNKGPQGGTGVMTGPQAVGNGTSYGMRYLVKMIFNIPMLVDKDDNDGNPPKGGNVNEKQVTELRKLFDRLSEPRQRKALEHFKLDIPDKEPLHTALANLQAKEYTNALKALAAALRNDNTVTITDEQEATLTALIEEIGGNCKADFLKTNKIKKVSELAASQYQGALAGLQQRRK